MMQQNHTNGRLTDRERTPARLIVLRVLFTLFAAGTVVFIFSNSMQSGAASGLRSAAVTQWLNGGLARMGVGWRFSERLVRKLGHFSEYALLGFWLMLSLRVYTRRILSHISWPLFFGLLAGVLDEGIQMFADGRGSDVRDVVIDFPASCLGCWQPCSCCCSCACSMFCGKAKRRFRRADARKPMFSVSTRP